jgi:uncharacterized protein YerC
MDALRTAARALSTAATSAEKGTPAIAWGHLSRAADVVELGRREVVAQLRAEGHTWGQIADVLGTPKPTLHRRYRCVDDGQVLVVDDDGPLAAAWSAVPVQRASRAAGDLSDDEWLAHAMADLR